MSELSRDEMLARASEASRYGKLPGGPVGVPNEQRNAETPEGVFSIADLYEVANWTKATSVPMPGGKRVWVHPVTVEDAQWLNVQARADARTEAKVRPFTTPREEAIWTTIRAQVYQVVCVCRVSETPGAGRVFKPENVDALQKNLPYGIIERIVATSEALDADTDVERQVLQDFFDACQSCMATWLSPSDGATLESSRSDLEAFASCVSRVKERGYLTTGDVEQLRALTAER